MKFLTLILLFLSLNSLAAPLIVPPPAWDLSLVSKAPGVKVEKKANDTDSSGAKLVRMQYIKVPGADMRRLTVEAVGNPPREIARIKVAFDHFGDKSDAQVMAVAARTIDALIGKESGVVQRIQTRWEDKRPGPFSDTINGIRVSVVMGGLGNALVTLDR